MIAAISYIVRPSDDRLLVVWNRRYKGWTMPGGMCEPGERPEQAQPRELKEETGLDTSSAVIAWDAPAAPTPAHPHRATHVVVFWVTCPPFLEPRETEPGCPVTWMTHDEFLDVCPFAPFYRAMFEALREQLKEEDRKSSQESRR